MSGVRRARVLRLATAGPQDTAPLAAAIEAGEIDPATIVAIVGKTEGNGCVNDFTRGYATLALKLLLADKLGCAPKEVEARVARTCWCFAARWSRCRPARRRDWRSASA